MVINPFEQLDRRLSNIECLLLDIKHDRQGHPPTPQPGNPDRRLDIKEAAAHIKRSRQTVYNLVSKRQIPHGRKGKNLWFIQSELDDWLNAGRRKTVTDLQKEADEELSKRKRG